MVAKMVFKNNQGFVPSESGSWQFSWGFPLKTTWSWDVLTFSWSFAGVSKAKGVLHLEGSAFHGPEIEAHPIDLQLWPANCGQNEGTQVWMVFYGAKGNKSPIIIITIIIIIIKIIKHNNNNNKTKLVE